MEIDMTDPTLQTCTDQQLRTRVEYAVKANDKAKVLVLKEEIKRRLRERGQLPSHMDN